MSFSSAKIFLHPLVLHFNKNKDLKDAKVQNPEGLWRESCTLEICRLTQTTDLCGFATHACTFCNWSIAFSKQCSSLKKLNEVLNSHVKAYLQNALLETCAQIILTEKWCQFITIIFITRTVKLDGEKHIKKNTKHWFTERHFFIYHNRSNKVFLFLFSR